MTLYLFLLFGTLLHYTTICIGINLKLHPTGSNAHMISQSVQPLTEKRQYFLTNDNYGDNVLALDRFLKNDNKPEDGLPHNSGLDDGKKPEDSLPHNSGLDDGKKPEDGLPHNSGLDDGKKPEDSLPHNSGLDDGKKPEDGLPHNSGLDGGKKPEDGLPHNSGLDDYSSSEKQRLPFTSVPILSDYFQKSLLTYSISGPTNQKPINITVIMGFDSVSGNILSTSSQQQSFQQALGLTLNQFMNTVNSNNVNFEYTLLNSTSFYPTTARVRKLATTQDYIVKFNVSIYTTTPNITTAISILRTFKNGLVSVINSGDFTTVFRSKVTSIPALSTVIITDLPMVYLSGYSPSSQGKLFITQQLDNILPSNTNSNGKNKNDFRDIIEATVHSFLIDTRLNDVKVKDVRIATGQSYQVDYLVALHLNYSYAVAYVGLFKKIITNAIQGGQFTSQLQLAAGATSYNSPRFVGATASIVPSYTFKYSKDNSSRSDDNSGGNSGGSNSSGSNSSGENSGSSDDNGGRGRGRGADDVGPDDSNRRTRVRTLNVEQELEHVDRSWLDDSTNYNTFQTVFKEAIANSLMTVSENEVEIHGVREKSGRKLQRILAGSSTNIIVDYSINVMSTSTDINTVNSLTQDISTSLNTVTTTGIFTNALISSAVAHDASSLITTSVSNPPTITSAAETSTTTTSTNKSDTAKSFTLTSGTGLGVLVAIVIIPFLILIAVMMYYCHRTITPHENKDSLSADIPSKKWTLDWFYRTNKSDVMRPSYNELFDKNRLTWQSNA